ncbi:tetratricopeptide repeat protein [uncultured Kordia sp.]|uniref:tetratricopeptide repeat protein n=1 Tax=uncultured Kordia sp. TaxID=507699 RepID=UPI00262E65D5|nr:tetratricopeptide repeat protein [uncultured Kordia sp.]
MKKTTLLIFFLSFQMHAQVDSLNLKLQSMKNDTVKVLFLNDLSRKNFGKNIRLAFEYLPQAITISKQLNYNKGLVNSYKNLGTAYFYTGKYDSTKVYWSKSLELISPADYKKKGDAHNNMGILYQRLGKVDSSLANYTKSLEYRIQTNDSISIAKSYNNLASFYRQNGSYQKALDFYFKALPIYKSNKLQKETSDALNGIGLLYKNLKNYDKALSYLEEAYEYRKEIKNPRLIASSINNIATIYYETDDYAKAKTYYQDYLEYALKIRDKRGLAGVYSNLGNISASEKKIEEAIEYYTKANDLFVRIGDIENAAMTFINLGGFYYKQEEYKKANEYYIQAKDAAEKSGSLAYRVDAHRGLTDTYFQLKNYELSHENFNAYITTKDSLFNKGVSEKVAFYQEQYEAEKKAKEIQILKTETIQKDKDIAVSKLYRNWAIVFSVLLIITLLLLYNRYKMKRKGFQLKEDLLKKEKKAADLDIQLQKKELELKAVELSSVTMNSFQKNELLLNLGSKLNELKDAGIPKSNVIKELEDLVKHGLNLDNNWSTFQKHFNNVHPNFFKVLNTKFPNLTNNDLKSCAYIRMNLSSKEVSILTNIEPKSVKMHRYRLKKKLELTKEDDLKNFLFTL